MAVTRSNNGSQTATVTTLNPMASNPVATTNASTSVVITHNSHGGVAGDFATLSGLSAVGGITVAGTYQIQSTTTNTYTITHGVAATSTTTGGGAVGISIVSTQHTLATETTAGVFQLQVDANALANGENVELRYYVKARNGGTERLAWAGQFGYSYTQATPTILCPPVSVVDHLKVTLIQLSGTGRAFEWATFKIA